MGLLDKYKAKAAAFGEQFGQFPGSQNNDAQTSYTVQPGQIQDLPLGPESVIRFRKQRGINLGQSSLHGFAGFRKLIIECDTRRLVLARGMDRGRTVQICRSAPF